MMQFMMHRGHDPTDRSMISMAQKARQDDAGGAPHLGRATANANNVNG